MKYIPNLSSVVSDGKKYRNLDNKSFSKFWYGVRPTKSLKKK